MLENYIQSPYLRALIILAIFFVALKILVFLIHKIFLKFARKTKTEVDDVLLAKTSSPITLLIILIGLNFAIDELPLAVNITPLVSKIIISLIIVVISYVVYLLVDLVLLGFLRRVMKRVSKDTGEALFSLFQGVLKILVFVIGILYILGIWGVEIAPFLAGLGIAGIAVAFALQESLANIFGGISIILDKTVKVNDLVYLDQNTKGRVMRIGLRSTQIRTFDNEVIIVPNSKMANTNIQNVALPGPKSRVVIPFSVAYKTNVEKVKRLIMGEIKKIKHFVDDPEPMVRFLEMGESSLNFKAYFHVDSFENRFEAIDEANTRIYNALNKAGIEIPFPQRDVHIKK